MSNNSSSPECAFCGRGLTVPILKNIPKNGSVYDVSECADCEIAMIHPLPSDAELTRLYSTLVEITEPMRENGLVRSLKLSSFLAVFSSAEVLIALLNRERFSILVVGVDCFWM